MKKVYTIVAMEGPLTLYWTGSLWTTDASEVFEWTDFEECAVEVEMILNRNDGMVPFIETAQKVM